MLILIFKTDWNVLSEEAILRAEKEEKIE